MPTVSMPTVGHTVDHVEILGRLELGLDRKPAGFLDGRRALATYSAPRSGARVLPVVRVTSTAPSRSRAATATSASCAGVFFAVVRPACERDADATERALVALPPVGARLQHRARQRVEMQQRDLPVGDAVGVVRS